MNKLVLQLLTLFCCLVAVSVSSKASTELICPVSNQITAQFDNGAAWEMCWDSRLRENIVLSDAHFQPAQGTPYSVFSSLRLSQLHVTYDDSNVTYNDVTQFGLGAGYIRTLTSDDCPNGQLIDIGGSPGLCTMQSTENDSYSTASENRKSQSLTVFSVSQVGAYTYLVTWKFFADGSVQPSVGAAGALQRSSDDEQSKFGRKLEGVPDKSWLSHTHNYYWRMDFDLGESSTDDVVSEINFNVDSDGRRARERDVFELEAARAIAPETMRSWMINDKTASDTAAGYLIEPVNHGHRHVDEENDAFTEYDFFVTRQNDCERFVSENAKFNPDCDENILQFVNDESLQSEDVVLWHRVSFHHVPRNEDRQVMHSHWDGFVMEARNLSQQTPGHSGLVADETLVALAATPSAITDARLNPVVTGASGCSITVSGEGGQSYTMLMLLLGALLIQFVRSGRAA